MKIYFPRQKAGEEGKVFDGLLRSIEKVSGKWVVKVSVPALSRIQNLYLELDDNELEMLRGTEAK